MVGSVDVSDVESVMTPWGADGSLILGVSCRRTRDDIVQNKVSDGITEEIAEERLLARSEGMSCSHATRGPAHRGRSWKKEGVSCSGFARDSVARHAGNEIRHPSAGRKRGFLAESPGTISSPGTRVSKSRRRGLEERGVSCSGGWDELVSDDVRDSLTEKADGRKDMSG